MGQSLMVREWDWKDVYNSKGQSTTMVSSATVLADARVEHDKKEELDV